MLRKKKDGAASVRRTLLASPGYPGVNDDYVDQIAKLTTRSAAAVSVRTAEIQDSRWDPGYWHPELTTPLKDAKYAPRPLGDFMVSISNTLLP